MCPRNSKRKNDDERQGRKKKKKKKNKWQDVRTCDVKVFVGRWQMMMENKCEYFFLELEEEEEDITKEDTIERKEWPQKEKKKQIERTNERTTESSKKGHGFGR